MSSFTEYNCTNKMFYLHSKDILAEMCFRNTKGLCQNSLKKNWKRNKRGYTKWETVKHISCKIKFLDAGRALHIYVTLWYYILMINIITNVVQFSSLKNCLYISGTFNILTRTYRYKMNKCETFLRVAHFSNATNKQMMIKY